MNARANLLPVDIHSTDLGELIGLLFDTQSYRFDYVARDELQRYANCAPSSNASLSVGPPASRRPPHTADVVSCVFESETALDRSRLNDFFDALQLRYGNRLWRYKGIVYVSNERPRLVIQGVQSLLQINGGYRVAAVREAAHGADFYRPEARERLD